MAEVTCGRVLSPLPSPPDAPRSALRHDPTPRIELRPDGAGTLLTLTDTFDDLGKAARDAAGWHECLDRLASDLDDTSPSAWGDRWRQLHQVYVTSLGPAASTIGPPSGWEEQQASQV